MSRMLRIPGEGRVPAHEGNRSKTVGPSPPHTPPQQYRYAHSAVQFTPALLRYSSHITPAEQLTRAPAPWCQRRLR